MFLELHLSDYNKKIMININRINSICQENEKANVYVGAVFYRVKENYEQIKEIIKNCISEEGL